MADQVVIAQGGLLPVSWRLGNAGLGPGRAQASLALIGRGTVRIGPEVTVPAFADIDGTVPPATVGLQWRVDSPPGSYQAFTVVIGLDPGSTFTEIEFFPLFVFDPVDPFEV